MTKDTPITRLLYAMLKQKDMKTINWNLVAEETRDITNGHAARMRFSRFKRQMEGGETTKKIEKSKPKAEKGRRASPKKNKDKIKRRYSNDAQERIKSEYRRRAEDSGGEDMPTPEMEGGMMHRAGGWYEEDSEASRIKVEPGISSNNMTPMPVTPVTSFSTPAYGGYGHEGSGSPSPNNSFGHHLDPLEPLDDMLTSFGGGSFGPGDDYYRDGEFGMSSGHHGSGFGVGLDMGVIGMPMGSADHHEDLWRPRCSPVGREIERCGLSSDLDGREQIDDPERYPVKSEPRWEREYTHQ